MIADEVYHLVGGRSQFLILVALNVAVVLMAYALYDCRQLLSMNNIIACVNRDSFLSESSLN